MAKAKREYNISEEDRIRRSELARKLNRDGKFGGKQRGAGRPKKQRAQETVAEKIGKEGDSIFTALKSALNSESPSIKLKAALAMLDIETKEEQLQMQEEQRMYDNLSKEKLLELVQQRLIQLGKSGAQIPGLRFDGIIEELDGRRIETDIIESGRTLPSGDSGSSSD